MAEHVVSSQSGASPKHVPITGSERNIVPGAVNVGRTDGSEIVTVTVLLRRRSSAELLRRVQDLNARHPVQRAYMTREEFAANHGAAETDVKQVEEFAKAYGLTVDDVNPATGMMTLSGSATACNTAFGVTLENYQHPDFSYRGHAGPVHVPESLKDIVTAVLGLDNRPQAKPHFRIYEESLVRSHRGLATAEPTASETDSLGPNQTQTAPIAYTPTQVAQLYNFPSHVNCSDECVAIIELGGGYNQSNLDAYFASLGVPTPSISSVSVDGASNQPTGSVNGPDGEVDLDIEVVGAVAPGVRIVVYFAPNTDAGFVKAITTAAHDATHKPSVISISWGGPESSWTSQSISAMNSAIQNATALGVTVCVAAGDNGSADGVNDGQFHVDFPASCPYALACGGTRLIGSGATIRSESVWNDGVNGGATGGGVSAVFALPTWQQNAHVPPSANPGGGTGRGVPDVAGDADPATGYQVLVDGNQLAIGGTSAVAPLWSGLVAIANHTLGHDMGFLNPVLYNLSSQTKAFHDITSGNNDINGSGNVYSAGTGWDPCTGLGSPDGANLIQALSQTGG